MITQPVKSSSISHIGYDEESKTMHVRFHTGHTYEYSDVPEEVYQDFISADSIGRHFNNMIQGNYASKKL